MSFTSSLYDLLIKGIPESFLFILAIFIFTRIKFSIKKYLIMSLIFTFIIYLTRWLPINLGTHTMLSLLILILLFIISNKFDLQNVIKTITSTIIMAIIIAACEQLNVILLMVLIGKNQTEKLLTGSSVKASLYELPSTIIFAVVILICFLIFSKIDKKKIDKNRKVKNGEIGAETGK